ncbi:hypothetical protein P691DRAFT_803291 [Macrolepiota fuliginosa MF-IS2]|uniref:CENP-V/GFA domain-containing protein n=1 Tax=Macrolepiota fuliginosa MF-IS2 TaxID=1400762 RepID=A0A9P5XC72_9AGAR|nr:hypothetical protein P691DRAFT_803291 [Macrolepiota fuliginosa MF-IS2]
MLEKTDSEPSQPHSLQASCFCGAISYRVEGGPVFSLYCHCTICQRIHASPFVHVIHYHTGSFNWIHTDPNALFTKSELDSEWKEWRCLSCLGAIASENPTEGRWSLRGAHFHRDAEGMIENWHLIEPTGHMFYNTRMLDVNDGLPKWEGYAGGSRRLDIDDKN